MNEKGRSIGKKNSFNRERIGGIAAIIAMALAVNGSLPTYSTQAQPKTGVEEGHVEETWGRIRRDIITGNSREAIRSLESSNISRANSEYHFLMGRAYQELRKNTLALASYSVSLYIRPDQAKAYINRALVRGALQDLLGAIDDLNAALILEPDNADAYLNRGVSSASLNQPKEAIQDFHKAIALRKKNPEAHLNLGLVFYIQGDSSKACNHWYQAGKLGSDEALSWSKEWCKKSPGNSSRRRANPEAGAKKGINGPQS